MCAKKYQYDDEYEQRPKSTRTSSKPMIRRIKMFDTYRSIKDLEKEGKFSEKEAASIVKVISNSIEQNMSNLSTKQDIELVKKDIEALGVSTKQDIELVKKDIEALGVSTKQDIEALRISTKQDIELVKKDIEALRIATQQDSSNIQARMATKEDLEKLRSEMTTFHTRLIGWIIGTFITLSGIVLTAVYYMIKYLPVIQPVIQHTPH